jgi:hypothetical protein
MATMDVIEDLFVAEVAEHDTDGVLMWRFERLRRAGYGAAAASRLARAKDVDLHVAIDLLGRGCDRLTALRILL